MSNNIDIEIGTRVIDREQTPDEQDEAIAVNLPPIPASEWEVHPRDCTLAEDNPDYPEDAQTVIVVFRDTFEERIDEGGDLPISIGALAGERVPFYAFPAPRLNPVKHNGRGKTEDEDDPPSDIERLAEVLRAGGFENVELDSETVVATKLGEEYRVDRSGGVIEAGAMGDRFETFVNDHYDPEEVEN